MLCSGIATDAATADQRKLRRQRPWAFWCSHPSDTDPYGMFRIAGTMHVPGRALACCKRGEVRAHELGAWLSHMQSRPYNED